MRERQTGFTLIEILVVIVILGILTTIAAGNFISSQKKSRDARRKEDLNLIARALEAYYNDCGSYPPSSDGKIMACGTCASPTVACTWGNPMQNDLGTLYMPQLPTDPQNYDYFYVSDGSSYQIYAFLENDKDRNIAQYNGSPGHYTGTDCGSVGLCNYGIASTNSSLASTEK